MYIVRWQICDLHEGEQEWNNEWNGQWNNQAQALDLSTASMQILCLANCKEAWGWGKGRGRKGLDRLARLSEDCFVQ